MKRIAIMRTSFTTNHSSLTNHQAGQGLLIAVLVMLLVALLGAAFVGVVSFNLAQSARHEDVVKADQMAKAGIEYADEQLTNSLDGADWRPMDSLGGIGAAPTRQGTSGYYDEIEKARGWADGYYIKFPDPRDPDATATTNPDFAGGRFLLKVEYPGGQSGSALEKFIKITSIGRSSNNPAVFKERVAYKPITLTDYVRFVTQNNPDPALMGRTPTSVLGVAPVVDFDNDAESILSANVAAGATTVTVVDASRIDNGDSIYIGSEPAVVNSVNDRTNSLTLGGPLANNHAEGEPVDSGYQVLTTLAVAANSGESTITVADAGGITNGDQLRLGRAASGQTVETVTVSSKTGNVVTITGTLSSNHVVGELVRKPCTEDSDGDDEKLSSEQPTTTIQGPVRFNGNARVFGNTVFSLDPNRKQKILIAGKFDKDTVTTSNVRVWDGSSYTTLYSSTDRLFTDANGLFLDGYGRLTGDRSKPLRWVDAEKPPIFVTEDQDTGKPTFLRFLELTKYSDNRLIGSTGATYGEMGYGKGIYINNESDDERQKLATSTSADDNRKKLIEEWMHPEKGGGGWVNHTEYQPPGVEIILRDDELLPAGSFSDAPDVSGYQEHPSNQALHKKGEPVIWVIRYDNPTLYKRRTGTVSPMADGRVIETFDYPSNGVIVAAGNVRIRGNLPQSYRLADRSTPQSGARDYNLTVVSGGTIYIEGNILSPKDRDGAKGSTTTEGSINDTKLALLAKDHVCLNTTKFMSRLSDQTDPTTATPPNKDHGNNSHWKFDNGENDILSREFSFGDKPKDDSRIFLAVRHAGSYRRAFSVKFNNQAGETSAQLNVRNGDTRFRTTISNSTYNVNYDLGSSQYDTIGEVWAKLATEDKAPAGADYTVADTDGTLSSTGSTSLAIVNDGDILNAKFYLPVTGSTSVYMNSTTTPYYQVNESTLTDYGKYWFYGGGTSDAEAPLRNYSFPAFTRGSGDGKLRVEAGERNVLRFENSASYPAGYRLSRFKIAQEDSSGHLLPGINIRINALIYAQQGSWFVIPGVAFDETSRNDNAIRYRRYNYSITIIGAVCENRTAAEFVTPIPIPSSTSVYSLPETSWNDLWSCPSWDTTANAYRWTGIQYIYDPNLCGARDSVVKLPRLPKLPLPDALMYVG